MSDSTKEFDKDLQDYGADADFDDVAKMNFDNFYAMKEALITKRRSLCTLEQMAKTLKRNESEIAEFELYYSDPTLSEVQEYALALLECVSIKVESFKRDSSVLYKYTGKEDIPTEIEYLHSDTKVTFGSQNTKKREEMTA